MIVFIRGTAMGRAVCGYLPLCQGSKGMWKPLGAFLLASADAAVQVCIDSLRADVHALQGDIARCHGERLGAHLGPHLEARLGWVDSHLARLGDRPRSDDRVVIGGRRCRIAGDGSVILPEVPKSWTLPGPGVAPMVLPGNSGDVSAAVEPGVESAGRVSGSPVGRAVNGFDTLSMLDIDESMVDVLRRAIREEQLDGHRARLLLRDLAREQPLDLLLAVAETTPERTADMAALVVAVNRRRGVRSTWHPDKQGTAGEPDEPMACDGVVQHVVEDEAPASDAARSEQFDRDEGGGKDPAGGQGSDDEGS